MAVEVEVVGFEVVSSRQLAAEGRHFLVLHRYVLRNRHADGGRSAEYLCDFVLRPHGLDAVVVALWRRGTAGIEVLLRGQLRPPLQLGRVGDDVAIPESPPPLLNLEVVAGLLETDDRGEEGVRRRAAIEALEEAGYRVAPEAVQLLGVGTFPTPGAFPERHVYAAAEVTGLSPEAITGDGHPLEEGGSIQFLPLDEAIARSTAGTIADSKTEIALRRLRDRLADG
jgi:ADP-ribose pyrophosphatase